MTIPYLPRLNRSTGTEPKPGSRPSSGFRLRANTGNGAAVMFLGSIARLCFTDTASIKLLLNRKEGFIIER